MELGSLGNDEFLTVHLYCGGGHYITYSWDRTTFAVRSGSTKVHAFVMFIHLLLASSHGSLSDRWWEAHKIRHTFSFPSCMHTLSWKRKTVLWLIWGCLLFSLCFFDWIWMNMSVLVYPQSGLRFFLQKNSFLWRWHSGPFWVLVGILNAWNDCPKAPNTKISK